jgi:2-methylcitrate dehydratase PrpD
MSAAVAEVFAAWAADVEAGAIPEAARTVARHALLDVAGLCIAARDADYVQKALAAWDADGPCTALGHARGLDAAGAAFLENCCNSRRCGS